MDSPRYVAIHVMYGSCRTSKHFFTLHSFMRLESRKHLSLVAIYDAHKAKECLLVLGVMDCALDSAFVFDATASCRYCFVTVQVLLVPAVQAVQAPGVKVLAQMSCLQPSSLKLVCSRPLPARWPMHCRGGTTNWSQSAWACTSSTCATWLSTSPSWTSAR